MADDDLLQWLGNVARKHGLADEGTAVAVAEDDDEAEDDDPEREYQELGGDAALLKLLGADDELFRTGLEKQRALAMDWEKDRRQSVVVWDKSLREMIDVRTRDVQAGQTWHDREKAQLEAIAAKTRELGDKLETEAGKELLYLIEKTRDEIRSGKNRLERARRESAQGRSTLGHLELHLQDVKQTYEAAEQRIRETRTELDNVLELEAMSLAEKIARLRGSSQERVGEVQKKLEAELQQIFKDGAAEDRGQGDDFTEAKVALDWKPRDWKPIEKKLVELESTSREKLEKEDPGRAKLQKKYDRCGGDKALFKKRLEAWKRSMDALHEERKAAVNLYRAVEKGRQGRLESAQLRLQETQRALAELKSNQARVRERMEELTAGTGSGDLLTPQESTKLQVLARERERLETDVTNHEKLVPIHRQAKENAARMLEEGRQLHEQNADNDALLEKPMPQSQDLHDLPLRSKFEELMKK